MSAKRRFIIAVDIGTTSMRACVYDHECRLEFFTQRPVSVEYNQSEEGRLLVEMDPDRLWADFKQLVEEAIDRLADRSLLAGLCLCCQRNTFISWDRETLQPVHPLITWKDERAAAQCKAWNKSAVIKVLRLLRFILRTALAFRPSTGAGRSPTSSREAERFNAAKVFKFVNAMVTHRFLATLQEVSVSSGSCWPRIALCLGTMDSWLQMKLTSGRSWATDASNASSTGLYDPFLQDWGHAILRLVGFPSSVLPELKPTAGQELGTIDEKIFGMEIPILCSVADSQAAAFGSNCLSPAEVKISLGTGTFVNVVTNRPHAAFTGVYPLVGWTLPDRTTFVVEARANDTATSINWALSVGLCASVEEASNFDDTPAQFGLCFVPAFNGIQTPHEDNAACAAFLGIGPKTSKRQMLRALVESIAFSVKQIWDELEEQKLAPKAPTVRLCGGPVERMVEPEFCSAKGAALLGGLTAGMWTLDDVHELVAVDRRFDPRAVEGLDARYVQWKKAVKRCLEYYE
ncbi:hypothetical protein M3Y99_00084300 [Aphelenchoides fujianensis]|nr:hypothetical protein M3Y99_00084300 [Aphelenchoides fujianensis]